MRKSPGRATPIDRYEPLQTRSDCDSADRENGSICFVLPLCPRTVISPPQILAAVLGELENAYASYVDQLASSYATSPILSNMSTRLCTEVTALCTVERTVYGYRPDLGGNSFFLAAFAIVLIAQTYLGIKYRTWSWLAALFSGCALEVSR